MRIVGGKHRGRTLKAPAGRAVRPTSVRAREALFDILAHGRLGGPALSETTVLDVFAGTGALGLEALSRGAAKVFALENDPATVRCLAANAKMLGEAERVRLIQADATHPPPAPAALAQAGWLTPGALVIVETASKEGEGIDPPEGFERLEARRYGSARLSFLRFIGV
jgi:16S rRNA (guanine966-N2)-methyltransferase